MNRVNWFDKTVGERGEYARTQDFFSVFECERVGLQRLALMLTANSEVVRGCLIRAFRECISSNSVSKEWARSWTRRVVIRNAISLVMSPEAESFGNKSDDADNGLFAFSHDDSLSAIAECKWILNLPELDRFVFVICVIERYSMYDCALLLDRSLRDINEARQRVGNQVGQIIEVNDISQRFAMR